jgi:hypothetical protein
MPTSWKHFLFIRLPIAVIVIGAACQIAAMALAHLPLRRNRIDELALAVLNDQQPRRIVLLGDSIIRNMSLRYAVGSEAQVLNLSTQQDVGLPGDYFLLARYLKTHPAPQHVVIAAAPDDYDVMPDPRLVHYYMWNTFRRPAERDFLKTYMPSIDARENYPAAMDLQERILEPLISLVRRSPAHFPALPPPPNPKAPVEPISDNQASTEATGDRVTSRDLSLAPMFRASIQQICGLSRQYDFTLHIVWAPMPPAVLRGDKALGHLAALQRELGGVFAATKCRVGPIFNMNDVQTFTNFDSGAFHLRGGGWEERGASVLAQYLKDLPDLPSGSGKPVNPEANAQTPVSDNREASIHSKVD